MMPKATSGTGRKPFLQAAWSQPYNVYGVNSGNLSLSVSTGSDIVLAAGQKITFLDWPSEGWTLTPANGADWSVSQSQSGNSLSLVCQSGYTYPVPIGQPSQNPNPITLNIGVPNAAETLTLSVVLQDDNGSDLTFPKSLTINVAAPGDPVVAYATGTSAVILSNAQDNSFGNTLTCALQNIDTAPASQTVTIVLSLWTYGQTGTPSQFTEWENALVSAPGATFAYDSSASTWSTQAPPTLWPQGPFTALPVTIANLPLPQDMDNPIGFIEVRFQISVTNVTPYNTSAWFSAYGPYTIDVTLDPTSSDAGLYRIATSADGFDLFFVEPGLNSPPLVPQLQNADGDTAYPPLAGTWSLSKHAIPPIAALAPGSNTLYWLALNENSVPIGAVTSCALNLSQMTGTWMPPLDFSGMNLSGQSLDDWHNLINATFIGANLTNTDLGNAGLPLAHLNNADLDGANLENAVLAFADLTNASLANVTINGSTNLTGATLAGVTSGGISGSTRQLPAGWTIVDGYLRGPS